MESLLERKRKSSGSGCVADAEKQLNEESRGGQTPKLLKMEFYSQDNPWPKCINSKNKLSVMEILNTEKTISNLDEECSINSSGIGSVDSEEHDEISTNLKSFEQSCVDTPINEDDEKSLDQVVTNTETVILNSGEKCSANSSGIISMEDVKHNEESTQSLESSCVDITSNKDDKKSSVEVSTKTTKIVVNSLEKCSTNSSVINSVENEKHNKESTKSLEPNHKDEKKSLDKELPADSSANTAIKNDGHEEPDLESFGTMASEGYYDMTLEQKSAWNNAITIRNSIKFFLINGYFEESFIKTYKYVYEMFIKFFNIHLKHLTVIDHGMEIFDKDEGKKVITDSLFEDDDGQIFMYFWTTTGSDITQGCTNTMRNFYHCKVNGHRHILEKPENGYNMKISDTFLVRLNPYKNEAQIGKFDRIVDKKKLQEMIRKCRG